jgi:hypothetical protein
MSPAPRSPPPYCFFFRGPLRPRSRWSWRKADDQGAVSGTAGEAFGDGVGLQRLRGDGGQLRVDGVGETGQNARHIVGDGTEGGFELQRAAAASLVSKVPAACSTSI